MFDPRDTSAQSVACLPHALNPKFMFSLSFSRTINSIRVLFGLSKPALTIENSADLFKREPEIVTTGLNRKTILVLGTGFGSMEFVHNIDVTKYKVIVISPRNYMAFSPLFTNILGGRLPSSSCKIPLRRYVYLHRGVEYLPAQCLYIDEKNNTILCKKSISDLDGNTRSMSTFFEKDFNRIAPMTEPEFDNVVQQYHKVKLDLNKSDDSDCFCMTYDYLVIGVGAKASSLGVPGVEEHACFLREVEDFINLKAKVYDNLKKATKSDVSVEEKKKLCHVVVCGGGPTGVESAGELNDYFKGVAKKYPELKEYLKITLIDRSTAILKMYTAEVGAIGKRLLEGEPFMDVILETGMKSVDPDGITIETKGEAPRKIESYCVASAVGSAPQDVVSHFLKENAFQRDSRKHGIVVDQNMKVKGTKNIFAFGDASFTQPPKLAELATILEQEASREKTSLGVDFLKKQCKNLASVYIQLAEYKWKKSEDGNNLTSKQFKELLLEIDASYMGTRMTAQAAVQQGAYLSYLFNQYMETDSMQRTLASHEEYVIPGFIYNHNGSTIYVTGGGNIMEGPDGEVFKGRIAKTAWYFIHIYLHYSWRHRAACMAHWMKSSVFGIDIVPEEAVTPFRE